VIGKHINNYEVVSLLGEGGMGTVYLALHPIMGRKAAIKVLKPELARDESLVSRFFNEARAANAIRHPNIIDIIDVGLLPDENVPYMLMEFLEGESLASRLERVRPLDVDTAVEIACQTASALAAAHSKGIVHRDLKPDNLFLVPDEMVHTGERVKVLDFGIAKLRDDMRGSSMKTRTGAIMGTASYMSPEQCQGLIEKIDSRTDVYALGIILYEMLCGAPPFVSEGFGDIIIMHVMREPEPPQRRNPAIPDAVSAAILCALAKDPNQRFATMVDFQTALRGHGVAHGTPVHGVPAVGTTAILDQPQSRTARQPSGLGFDLTMATPPPVLVSPGNRPPSKPPSHVPTVVEPTTNVKQSTTTFRTATGEVSDTDMVMPGKSRTKIAVIGGAGLVAVGIAATIFLTRTPPTKEVPAGPAATAPAPEPEPAALAAPPAPEPAHGFEPPAPAPEPTHTFAPTPTPTPSPAEESKHHKKGVAGKAKKAGAAPEAPEPPPSPASTSKKDSERW
jgi:serine/threonine protein kinase